MPDGAGAAAAVDPPDTEAQFVPVRALIRRLACVAALVALDLASKSLVFAWVGEHAPYAMCHPHATQRYPLAGDWLALMLSTNKGMAWGIEVWPWLLVGGRVAACAFLVWLIARTPPARRVLTGSLVAILAGALGNLYDNLALDPRDAGATFGEVRDFVDVYFTAWDYHFPTFNVADACITVGAVLLFAASFFRPHAASDGAASA
jgi:signal peptidase II